MYNLTKKRQQGATLLVVLMLLLVMMVLAISIAANSSSHAIIATNSVLKKQASQAAESGSDIILALINEDEQVITDLRTKKCSEEFTGQYFERNGKNSGIGTEDQRSITSSWYACVPAETNQISCPGNSSDCVVVVITGVACPKGADITEDSKRKGCVVSRHLQSYAILSSQ